MSNIDEDRELMELIKKDDKSQQITYLTYLLGIKTGKDLALKETNKAS